MIPVKRLAGPTRSALSAIQHSTKSFSSQDPGKWSSSSPPPPPPPPAASKWNKMQDALKEVRRERKSIGGNFDEMVTEAGQILRQVKQPGMRGAPLREFEKDEIYRLHDQNPEHYTVEKLAKDFKVMKQRVHAILWLKKNKKELEKKLGKPLDDRDAQEHESEIFQTKCREFHVASLPYRPNFKVMPEDWDGIPKDLDEVHYEISKKQDDMLYEEFLLAFEFNKRKLNGEIKCHKYSRRREDSGWKYTVEKLGPNGKRGNSGGGWKFVSEPDGSSRPLNELEKLFLKRETPKWRRKILPPTPPRKLFALAT